MCNTTLIMIFVYLLVLLLLLVVVAWSVLFICLGFYVSLFLLHFLNKSFKEGESLCVDSALIYHGVISECSAG